MYELFFPTLSSDELLDRFFEQFFILFPNFVSLEIKGDDGNHKLAFASIEEISKSIRFIKHIYHNNRELTCFINTKVRKETISIIEKNNIHKLSLEVADIEVIFLLLKPLWIQSKHFYYSDACFKVPISELFKKISTKQTIQEWMIKNYRFRNEMHQFLKKIDVIARKNNNYQYNFQTFLPEKVSESKLLRLLIYQLARKFDTLSHLQYLHLSHKIVIDKSLLKDRKELHFSSIYFHLQGFIKPTEKIINLHCTTC